MAVERRASVLGSSAPSRSKGLSLKRRPPTEVGGLSLEFRVYGFGFRVQGLWLGV